jgi:hypothetical protein
VQVVGEVARSRTALNLPTFEQLMAHGSFRASADHRMRLEHRSLLSCPIVAAPTGAGGVGVGGGVGGGAGADDAGTFVGVIEAVNSHRADGFDECAPTTRARVAMYI